MKFIKMLLPLAFLLPVYGVHAGDKDILLIESYEGTYDWDAGYLKGFRGVIGNKYNVMTFEMDTKRVPKDKFPEQAEKAMAKIKEVNPRMVVLGDDNALNYIGPKLLNQPIQVVYLGINNNLRNYNIPLTGVNVTGVLERPLLKKSLASVKEIIPSAKKILVLFDSGETSQASIDEEFSGQTKMKILDLDVEAKMIGNVDEWKKTVAGFKGQYDAVILGLYHTVKDASQKVVNANELATWTSENSAVPLFAFWDFAVGKSYAIGGLVLSGETMGKTAANVVLSILDGGKKPQDLKPIVEKEGKYIFSKTGLQKWKLSLPNNIQSEATFID